MEFELFGLKFDVLNCLALMIIGALVCCMTICSCANMEKVMATDFRTEMQKLMHKFK